MVFQHKSIRKRLYNLAIVFTLAALAEYLLIVLLGESPLLRLKAQAVVGLAFLAYSIHITYQIWYLANNPFHENGMQD